MGGGPRVLVATSINPQIVGGETYFYRLVAQDTRLPSAAPLLKSYANVESLSIAELNEFIISASSQEIDFICTEKVTGIKLDKGLCYLQTSNALSQLSPGCIVLILMLLVSNHLYTSYLHSLMLVSTHIFNLEI
ncbi:unnamed protein product [Brassica oleracea]